MRSSSVKPWCSQSCCHWPGKSTSLPALTNGFRIQQATAPAGSSAAHSAMICEAADQKVSPVVVPSWPGVVP